MSFFLNSTGLEMFLISKGIEFHIVWLRKKKDLFKLFMLDAVDAIFVTKDKLSRWVDRRRLLPL